MRTRSHYVACVLVVAAGSLAIACGDTLTGPEGLEEQSVEDFEPQFAVYPIEELVAVSDLNQTAVVGTRVPDDPAIRAVGLDGAGVPDVPVEFRVLNGGGSVTQAIVITDENGVASTGWILGPVPGTNRVRAIVTGEERINFSATGVESTGTLGAVVIEPGELQFAALGGMQQLTATGTDESGGSVPIAASWRSLNPAIATVDSTGMVRSVAVGATRIIATSAEGLADSAVVSVTQVVSAVVVTPPADTLEIGETRTLQASARDANGYEVPGTTFLWRTNDRAVATVADGTVTAVGVGSTRIRAVSDTVIGRSRITVVASDTTPPPPPPPPGDLVFGSDFSTALGTSDAALRDTGKEQPWTGINGNGRLNEVIPSSGLDFPTANVLRVTAGARSGGGAQAQTHRLDDALPVPAVGESLFYRWYIRVVAPNSYMADPETHPIQDAGPSSQNWVFNVILHSNGTWTGRFGSGATAWPNNNFGTNLIFQKGQTYRFEMRVLRIGATTFRMEARAYDSAGNLLYDSDDFLNSNRSGSLADAPTLSMFNPAFFDGMTAGFNGLAAGGPEHFPMTLYYQSGFCVRTDTWCGAYAPGEGN